MQQVSVFRRRMGPIYNTASIRVLELLIFFVMLLVANFEYVIYSSVTFV